MLLAFPLPLPLRDAGGRLHHVVRVSRRWVRRRRRDAELRRARARPRAAEVAVLAVRAAAVNTDGIGRGRAHRTVRLLETRRARRQGRHRVRTVCHGRPAGVRRQARRRAAVVRVDRARRAHARRGRAHGERAPRGHSGWLAGRSPGRWASKPRTGRPGAEPASLLTGRRRELLMLEHRRRCSHGRTRAHAGRHQDRRRDGQLRRLRAHPTLGRNRRRATRRPVGLEVGKRLRRRGSAKVGRGVLLRWRRPPVLRWRRRLLMLLLLRLAAKL
jgi:hypothetical protein